eukprot:750480-Hanusia_phi.AAC.2
MDVVRALLHLPNLISFFFHSIPSLSSPCHVPAMIDVWQMAVRRGIGGRASVSSELSRWPKARRPGRAGERPAPPGRD